MEKYPPFKFQSIRPSSAMVDKIPHFLLVAFPAQGHINPLLEFAKRLMGVGAKVTLATSVFAHRTMINKSTPLPHGLNLAPFSDGYDNGFDRTEDASNFMSTVKRHGAENLTNLVLGLANAGNPITYLIHGLLLSWVAEVAKNLQLPSILLWIQPATVFDIYHYYFHGYREIITANNNDSSHLIELPGLPLLTCLDIPSFFLPSTSNPYAFVLDMFQKHFQVLDRLRELEKPMRVLVNTFNALEPEALSAVDKVSLIGIGPLVPSALLGSTDTSNHSSVDGSKDNYIEWLNSKEESSVVYLSFGTIVMLGKKQVDEIAGTLVQTGRPFLWVIRTADNNNDKDQEETILNLVTEQKQGLIVPWCSQVKVLSHPSVGCFVTHCGWNSTLETMLTGVPVVAFPQWTDQMTNAKLIVDVCKMGVRVKVNEEDKVLESEELKRCLEMVMDGGEGEEMKRSARKWKDLARTAVEEGGSSHRNLLSFLEETTQGSP